MATQKTLPTDIPVNDFIRTFVQNDQKIAESFALVELMEHVTGQKPVMWGPSIIGFGQYNYQSDRSAQKGIWPRIGFSPRKAAFSLYVYSGTEEQKELLKELGTFTMGKGCIYVKKMSDINKEILVKMIETSLEYLEKKYGK